MSIVTRAQDKVKEFATEIDGMAQDWAAAQILLPLESLVVAELCKHWDLLEDFYGPEAELTKIIRRLFNELQFYYQESHDVSPITDDVLAEAKKALA